MVFPAGERAVRLCLRAPAHAAGDQSAPRPLRGDVRRVHERIQCRAALAGRAAASRQQDGGPAVNQVVLRLRQLVGSSQTVAVLTECLLNGRNQTE